jgi:aminopeptidase N
VRTQRVELDVTGERPSVAELTGVPAGDVLLVNDDDLTYAQGRARRVASTEVVTRDLTGFSTRSPAPRSGAPRGTWCATASCRRALRRARAPQRRPEPRSACCSGCCCVPRAPRSATPTPRTARGCSASWRRHAHAAGRAPSRAATTSWPPPPLGQLRPGRRGRARRRRAPARGRPRGRGPRARHRPALAPGDSLARAGGRSGTRIDAELERDDTDLGQRHAATARAAQPRPAIKEEVFSAAPRGQSLSHTMSRQLWGGFSQLDQPEVLAPYVEPVLRRAAGVWEARSLDWALEFSRGCSPHPAAGDDLLDEGRRAARARHLPTAATGARRAARRARPDHRGPRAATADT